MQLGALHRIGSLYREGLGVERDWAKAKEWYLKVTTAEPKKDDKEMVPFWFSIGSLYFHGGPGIAQDYTEAMTWFLKAAKFDDAEAHYQIGLCYEQGHLNGERNESAMEWFRLATARGHRQAQERVNPQPQKPAQKRKQGVLLQNRQRNGRRLLLLPLLMPLLLSLLSLRLRNKYLVFGMGCSNE